MKTKIEKGLFDQKEKNVLFDSINGTMFHWTAFNEASALKERIASHFDYSVEDGFLTEEELTNVYKKIETASEVELKQLVLDACKFWDGITVQLPLIVRQYNEEGDLIGRTVGSIPIELKVEDMNKVLFGDIIDKMLKEKAHICSICGRLFEGYGNNPKPVEDLGVCCDECNRNVVIPARISLIRKEAV